MRNPAAIGWGWPINRGDDITWGSVSATVEYGQPTQAQRFAELRTKMLEHLEAALACADETKDETVGYCLH
jgi:hypothetical protein